jgi:hypothetical protein
MISLSKEEKKIIDLFDDYITQGYFLEISFFVK